MATEKLIKAGDLWSDIMMLPHNGDMISSEEVEQAIIDAPTVDAVKVVRCKDCKHRTEMANCGHPRQDGILPTAYPLDFCSYGERRNDV